jgi:phosphatidylserine/phosphatidylglycerophosphate/cardiolipin synthase-like enzyme
MTILNAAFPNVGITKVSDGEYYQTVIQLIRRSVGQCLCNIFIVDHDLLEDLDIRVDGLLLELANATWRGVDTKLLVGGSRDNSRIRGAGLLAWARARELGVDARLAAASRDNSSHVKLVVADAHVLLGSHNWSRGMFGAETQDSVLLESQAFAAAMSTYFAGKWAKAARDEYDVSV